MGRADHGRRGRTPPCVPTIVREFLHVIKDFHGRGIEPTALEVAEAVGMESRPPGRIMKDAEIQAVTR